MQEVELHDESPPILFAEFADGHSFRNLIEYLKSTNTEGNFVFSADQITYSKADATNTVLNDVVIWTSKLSNYQFRSPEPIMVGVNNANLRAITKSIGRKDSVQLAMYQNDIRLYLQIIGANAKPSSQDNINIITPRRVTEDSYYIREYTRNEGNPNCSVLSTNFCKMCAAMNSIKCTYVTIIGLYKEMVFKGMMEGDIIGRVQKFVNDESLATSQNSKKKGPRLIIQNEEPVTIRTRIATIKALSKINNLSNPSGMIKMYLEPDRPLKLVSNVGNYGQITIYLRDIDTVETPDA